jgi:hypothetical protein
MAVSTPPATSAEQQICELRPSVSSIALCCPQIGRLAVCAATVGCVSSKLRERHHSTRRLPARGACGAASPPGFRPADHAVPSHTSVRHRQRTGQQREARHRFGNRQRRRGRDACDGRNRRHGWRRCNRGRLRGRGDRHHIGGGWAPVGTGGGGGAALLRAAAAVSSVSGTLGGRRRTAAPGPSTARLGLGRGRPSWSRSAREQAASALRSPWPRMPGDS